MWGGQGLSIAFVILGLFSLILHPQLRDLWTAQVEVQDGEVLKYSQILFSSRIPGRTVYRTKNIKLP